MNEYTHLDTALRPDTWEDYVGQEAIKNNLQLLLSAAKKRNQSPEHIIFYGPPGLGKTTLSHLIAKELSAQMKVTSGPAIEKVGDLASLLTNLNPGDILFIDEIHRLNKAIEEILYPAMESHVLDIIIGKGPSARTIQLELPPFTLIAATTRMSLLSSPLRSRFSGGIFRLVYYSTNEIATILRRSSKVLGIEAHDEALFEIAKRSRFTPRTANYLLKRCRDYAQVHERPLDMFCAQETLRMLEIDDLGLFAHDRLILETIIDKFHGGPVGLGTIATSLQDDPGTLEDVHEPFLIQTGLLERTQRGRVATKKAYKHVGFIFPDTITSTYNEKHI